MAWQGAAPQQAPAGPAPGVTYGGFWIRFVAYVIDAVILYVVLFVALAISTALALIVELAFILYFPLCWMFLGQTIGMMPFGLRVVRNEDGGKLTWTNVILRMIGFIISAVCLYIGLIWAAFEPRKRGWHDMIGGTVVIKNA
jgi:uncharacterized RDD family membrane protein YckC